MTYHSIRGFHIQEVTGGIPPEQVVPQRSLEVVARIQVNRVQIRLCLLQLSHLRYNASISADARVSGFGLTRTTRRIRLLEPVKERPQIRQPQDRNLIKLRIITVHGNRSGG